MADDKLKTGPESPGSDIPGDAPVENASETAAPEKAVEPTEPGMSPVSPPEQSVLPGVGGDTPARTAPGEVVCGRPWRLRQTWIICSATQAGGKIRPRSDSNGPQIIGLLDKMSRSPAGLGEPPNKHFCGAPAS